MSYDRTIFFDKVRASLFGGKLSQSQVDGMNAILDVAEFSYADWDARWVAYCLATTYHETSSTMQPIEEYGKGGSADYAKKDPQTGQTYYGRGYVQLTWRENYAKADKELDLSDDRSCEWHAENALDPGIASAVMFIGMQEGWFRKSSDGEPQTLARYFNDTRDDAYGAREIINGDKAKVPTWSNGVSIGNLIKGYHGSFLVALNASFVPDVVPEPPKPEPEPPKPIVGRRFEVSIEGIGTYIITIRPLED